MKCTLLTYEKIEKNYGKKSHKFGLKLFFFI